MKRIVKEAPLATFHKDISTLWRSRLDELETQVFDQYPFWMNKEPIDFDEYRDRAKLIDNALESIGLREKKVIFMRYYLDMTLDEVADTFSRSRERVRQIEIKALRKLSHESRLLNTLIDKD